MKRQKLARTEAALAITRGGLVPAEQRLSDVVGRVILARDSTA